MNTGRLNLSPPEFMTHTASRSVQPFLRAIEHGRFNRIRQVAPVSTLKRDIA